MNEPNLSSPPSISSQLVSLYKRTNNTFSHRTATGPNGAQRKHICSVATVLTSMNNMEL